MTSMFSANIASGNPRNLWQVGFKQIKQKETNMHVYGEQMGEHLASKEQEHVSSGSGKEH